MDRKGRNEKTTERKCDEKKDAKEKGDEENEKAERWKKRKEIIRYDQGGGGKGKRRQEIGKGIKKERRKG